SAVAARRQVLTQIGGGAAQAGLRRGDHEAGNGSIVDLIAALALEAATEAAAGEKIQEVGNDAPGDVHAAKGGQGQGEIAAKPAEHGAKALQRDAAARAVTGQSAAAYILGAQWLGQGTLDLAEGAVNFHQAGAGQQALGADMAVLAAEY